MTKGTNEIKKAEKAKKLDTLNYYNDVLRRAEIKRVAEKVTKKELATSFGYSYTFYMNCLIKRNRPSKPMIQALESYLETPTGKVYEMIFNNRKADNGFHEGLELTDEYVSKVFNELEDNGTYHLSQVEHDAIIRSLQGDSE